MQNEILTVFRILAFAVFVVALYAGYYMFKNYEKLFGVDPNMPSEGSNSRSYSQMQVFVIWAHVVIASGVFALMLE
jgi:hypothetical protein